MGITRQSATIKIKLTNATNGNNIHKNKTLFVDFHGCELYLSSQKEYRVFQNSVRMGKIATPGLENRD
jgi:hypothetical protein